jgi:hypothetical protein
MKLKNILTFAVTCALLIGPLAANAVSIDSFEAGGLYLSLNNAAVGDADGPETDSAAGIIGGTRTGTVTMTDTQGGNADVEVEVVSGVLDVSNKNDANATVDLLWDSDGAGLGGVDLTAGGAEGFFVAFPNPINNELTIAFDLNSGASTTSSTFPDGAFGDAFFFPFSLFNDGGAAASSVDSILMTLSDGFAWDAQIDFVETRETPRDAVPAPVPALLIAAGLVGIGLARRRRT